MPTKKGKNGSEKSSVKRRSVNRTNAKPGGGAPSNEQDVKKRLGQFTGAGEHPMQGTRAKGKGK
jgi:hypothetical protein